MRFLVKIGKNLLKSFERDNVGRKQILGHFELKLGRRAGDQRKSHVARKIFSGIAQGVLIVELAKRFGGRALHFQQIGAQRAAIGHPGERRFIGWETRRIERAHGGKNLLARLDVHARIRFDERGWAGGRSLARRLRGRLGGSGRFLGECRRARKECRTTEPRAKQRLHR